MAAGRGRWMRVAAVAGFALCAWPVLAQDAAFRCPSRGTAKYSDIPCTGGRPVGPGAPRATDKSKAPPQDRAVAARRAKLSPEDRQECSVLDIRMREEQRMLKAKGTAVTLQDEMPLVRMKKKSREMKC